MARMAVSPALRCRRDALYDPNAQERTNSADSVEKDTVMPPRFQKPFASPACPVEVALGFIGGKWKGILLYHLLEGTLRFNAIRRRMPGVTQRMLTTQLRELEADGLIVRVVYAEVPPRVEYSLSVRGRTLEPVIMALKLWGEQNADQPPAQEPQAA
jgi:DNA-binding HxlR family transcriptional regulator